VMDPPGPLADSGAPDPVVVTAVWFVARRRFSAPNSGRTASARPQIRAVNHLAPGARAARPRQIGVKQDLSTSERRPGGLSTSSPG
jgi:hypothetical protein